MSEDQIRKELINNLFIAFGKGDDKARQGIYLAMLKDIPTKVLQLVCRKAYLEEQFLPSIAKLVADTKSLIGEADQTRRVKEWAEAWEEIDKAMRSTPWGKTPTFSTPEITMAVNSYGWNTLQTSLAEDMPTVRAQVRRMYEDACKRIATKNTNEYILDGAGAGLLNSSPDKREGVQKLISGSRA